MINIRSFLGRFKKEDIPESKEMDQKVRKRRFGSRIDPILEREFYRWMQIQEKIENKIEKYNNRINTITHAITLIKQNDKQLKEKIQLAQNTIFMYKRRIEELEQKLAEEKERKLDDS